ncbi:hypothetical protein F4810DRAFT_555658 [Camillea tinctor]|nr:hypothetical protein F4810DRAFT_555658 [Camillea tinctor]
MLRLADLSGPTKLLRLTISYLGLSTLHTLSATHPDLTTCFLPFCHLTFLFSVYNDGCPVFHPSSSTIFLPWIIKERYLLLLNRRILSPVFYNKILDLHYFLGFALAMPTSPRSRR